MSQTARASTATKLDPADDSYRTLFRQLLFLSTPVMAEHVLHMLVGLTDTYLANHLPTHAPAATAAVGTIAYITWFLGLIVSSIGTGSTAIIARAVGARHRSLANSVTGQSVAAAAIAGLALAVVLYVLAAPITHLTQLSGVSQEFALSYLRMLCFAIPFSTVMFVINSCLRGAGDTLTPAVAMIVVDVVNIVFSFALTRGWWGLPEMGFDGIAVGTVIAFVCGGVLQSVVLIQGRGGLRLHLHRLRPHWVTLKRILRIGIPSGTEGLLTWVAQFAIVIVINGLDPTDVWAAAHINTIRIEAFSFMSGFAIATATATMVGQSLGMRNARRAKRATYLSFALGGGVMVLWGVLFVLFPEYPARWLAGENQRVAELTAACLYVVGFSQAGFAAAVIFTGALRGAGDTFVTMFLNLASVIGLRFLGVMVVAFWFDGGLVAIWIVLAAELMIRGLLLFGRFLQGGWRHIEV